MAFGPFEAIRNAAARGRERRQNRREGRQTGVAAPTYGAPNAQAGRFQDMATNAGAQYGASRDAQRGALEGLQAAAAGEAPSQAQAMLAQNTARTAGLQQALTAGGRGGNMAGQARQGAAAGAAAMMGGQEQAAQLRAAEMESARAALANQANTMAGMDTQRQLAMEGLSQGAYQTQLAAELQQRGLNIGQVQNDRNFGLGILGGVAGVGEAAGKLGMLASDERLKMGVEGSGLAVSQAMGEAPPVTFQYKDAPGDVQPGILAGDLERTPAGRAIVENTNAGKMIDHSKGLSFTLAGLSEHEQRLREVERMLAAAGGAQ